MKIINLIEEEMMMYGKPCRYWYLKDEKGTKYRSRKLDWNEHWAIGLEVDISSTQIIDSNFKKTGVYFLICSPKTAAKNGEFAKRREEVKKKLERIANL